MTNKLLIVTGPTATGKTALALQLAKQFSGEIISADSRQAVVGRDIITGKDLPQNAKYQISNVKYLDGYLKYFEINFVKVWGYDIVETPGEFSVSSFRRMFDLVYQDIVGRGLLPIVVGGSGLYIKSLLEPLNLLFVPPDPRLRNKLVYYTAPQLFALLAQTDPSAAAALNQSDRSNPVRLIRKIEIANFFIHNKLPSPQLRRGAGGEVGGNDAIIQSAEGEIVGAVESGEKMRGEVIDNTATENRTPKTDQLVLGLTAPREYLFAQVDRRVDSRIALGAAKEDLDLAADPFKWKHYERGLVKKQLTWFKKQSGIHWLDISQPGWNSHALTVVTSWYNQLKTVN